MGWYDAIKDGIAVAQQVDNIPLVEKLIEAQKQILDLVNENQKLREQIREMQETTDIAGKIERHEDAYITLADDPDRHIYCSCCWDTKKILVQGQKTGVEMCIRDSTWNRQLLRHIYSFTLLEYNYEAGAVIGMRRLA